MQSSLKASLRLHPAELTVGPDLAGDGDVDVLVVTTDAKRCVHVEGLALEDGAEPLHLRGTLPLRLVDDAVDDRRLRHLADADDRLGQALRRLKTHKGKDQTQKDQD